MTRTDARDTMLSRYVLFDSSYVKFKTGRTSPWWQD